MKKQKELIEETYQDKDIVKVFDKERNRYSYQRYKHKVESKFLKDTLKKFKKPIRVLDVACGTGRMLPEVFSVNRDIFYTGFDSSMNMVYSLLEKAGYLNKPVRIKIGDAMNIPYPDNSFDVVYTYHLLWHLPQEEQEKVIKEMLRVCKPNGYIHIDFLNKNFIFEKFKHLFKKPTEGIYKFSLKEIESIIQTKDYKIKKLCDFPVKNTLLYKCLNILNLFRFMLPLNFYHMCFLRIKKGGDTRCFKSS